MIDPSLPPLGALPDRGHFSDRLRQYLGGLGLRALVKNAGILSGGTIVAQLAAMAVMPIVTRLYGTAAFGLYASFTSTTAILAILASLRLGLAVPLSFSNRIALALTEVGLLFSVTFSLILAVGALVAVGFLHLKLLGEVDPYLPWLSIALPVAAAQMIFDGWNVRQKAFRLVAVSTTIGAVLSDLAQLAGGVLKVGTVGLILGLIVGQYITVICQGWGALKTLLVSARRRPSVRIMLRALSSNRQFIYWNVPASFVNVLGLRIVPIAVVFIYGAKTAGLFFLADRVVMIPVGLVTSAVSLVMRGEIAKLRHTNPKRIRPLFLAVSFGALALMTPMLLIIPFGRELFGLVFGSSWKESGSLCAILLISALSCGLGTVVSCLSALGHNHWHMIPESIRLTLVVAVICAAILLKFSLTAFVVAIAIAWSVGYLVLFLLNYIAIGRTERGNWGYLKAM